MNRERKIRYFVILIFAIFLACTGNKNLLEVKQSTNDYPVVIRLSKRYNKIFRVKIPLELNLKNNTIKKRSFTTVRYDYASNNGVMEFLYREINEKLIEVKNNSKKSIQPYSGDSYIIYSSHKLDSTSLIQDQFKPYIKKMLSENKDTLHIGTVKEFKTKHEELFKKLTKNDSISIQLLDGKEFGERITVPVRW